MARFHFDIIDGENHIEDEEGIVRPDLESARHEAIRGLRSIIASEVENGRVDLNVRIVIREGSTELHYVSGHDVVRITGL